MQGKYNIINFKIVITLLAVFFCIGFAYAEEYRKPVPSLPITFNPQRSYDAYSMMVENQIFDRLFDLDEYLYVKPKLVSSWSSSSDGKIWTFQLRKDVTFHDNEPLKADDVIFSIHKMLEKGSVRASDLLIIKGAQDFHKGKTSSISGITSSNPYVLQIELERPFPLFISIFTAPNTEIVPNNYNGKSSEIFFKHPIGTGPFKFESYEKDKFVKLVGNTHYFLGSPKLKTIVYEIADRQKAISGFNSGYYQDIEWFFPELKELTHSYTVIKMPRAHTSVIAFNTRMAPLNNIHVRKAISYIFDRDALLNTCYSDRIPANAYVPSGLGGYYPELPAISYNATMALSEIKAAKLDKKVLERELILYRPDNYPCKKYFEELITNNAKKIGFNIRVIHLPLGVFAERYYTSRKFDMINLTYPADFPEALFMLSLFKSDHTDNYTGIKSAKIDKLLDKAMYTANKYERFEIYKMIQEEIKNEFVIVPLYHDVFSSIYQTNVRGIKRTPLTSYIASMFPVFLDDKAADE